MTFVVADRVQETCAAPGTGTVSLLGAATGYQAFSAGIGNANTTFYTIADQGGSNWEVGIGTYTSSGNTLSRTTVLVSSNGGSLVNFSSGIQNVWCDYPAGKAVYANGTTLVAPSGALLPVANGGTGVSTSNANLVFAGPSTGATAAPSFRALVATDMPASVDQFPSGTALLFQQTAAPTGWTKVTTNNDAALRVVSGTVTTGGTVAFSAAFTSKAVSGTVGGTTLTTAQIPGHTHNYSGTTSTESVYHQHTQSQGGSLSTVQNVAGSYIVGNQNSSTTGNQNQLHTHTYSGTTDGGTGGGGSHTHSFTGTAINLAVKYVDVIIATKN